MNKSSTLHSTNGASPSEAVEAVKKPSGADHLGNYSKWDQAVAGHIVGRLMLAGILSSDGQADDELISLALVVTARALRVIPDDLKAQEWPRD